MSRQTDSKVLGTSATLWPPNPGTCGLGAMGEVDSPTWVTRIGWVVSAASCSR